MACPKCGHKYFLARQVWHADVLVDNQNNFVGLADGYPDCIYETGEPYGPYVCLNCRAEYEELPR